MFFSKALDERPRWLVLFAVAALVIAAGFVTYSQGVDAPQAERLATSTPQSLSPLSVGKDTSPRPDPPASQQRPAPPPTSPTPRSETPDQRFMRLASSADPRDRAAAYDLARDCMVEEAILVGPRHVQVHPRAPSKCRLAQGHWQDVELRRKLIVAKVERAEFNASQLVLQERSEAFKDDPQAFTDLLRRAHEIGVASAEPIALTFAASAERLRGDAYSDARRPDEAKTSYQQALVYAVAAAVNSAKVTGKASVDLGTDPEVVALAAKLDRTSAELAIQQGRQYAEKWPRELVDRALGR